MRWTRDAILTCTTAWLFAGSTHAQDSVPINSKWLSDRVLVTWACDYFQGTNMAVVVTDSGLLIIDTGLSPSTVRRQRSLVEQEIVARVFARSTLDTEARRGVSLRIEVEESRDLLDAVVIMWINLHIARGTEHVHENHRNPCIGCNRCHIRIETKGADIVDDGRPCIECPVCHTGFIGIDADGNGEGI